MQTNYLSVENFIRYLWSIKYLLRCLEIDGCDSVEYFDVCAIILDLCCKLNVRLKCLWLLSKLNAVLI